MKLRKSAIGLLLASTLAAASSACAAGPHTEHVLLISVDGLHALDVARFIEGHPASAMAELARHGITYSNASTPAHTDSFPGLLALVTGGSPVSHGVFYDVSYDRSLFDPANTACSGAAGNTVVFDESIDRYTAANVSLNVIDAAKLPRGLDEHGNCVPVFPHSVVKTNTIFEVVKATGGRTAWADKHPAYDLVNGPSGHGVDDLFTPEIAADGITDDVGKTEAYDDTKVAAILHEIDGRDHTGGAPAAVP